MRLFIAIGLENEKDFFKSIQDKIDKSIIKAKFTSIYHLTLKFLGEVDESKIREIKEKLEKIKFKPYNIGIDKIGFFPNEDYVKVIWIGLKENKETINLQREIDNSLADMFDKDDRFHPHITLARVNFIKDKKTFKENIEKIKIESKEFKVKSFRLVKSTLTEEGPVYEDLAEVESIDL